MKHILNAIVAVTFGAAMSLGAAAQTGMQSGQESGQSNGTMAKQSAGTTNADTRFMKKAAQGGMAEVELGQLAEQKASSDQVKQFAQRMVHDHTKANDELKQVAEQEHVNLPTSLNMKDKATKAKLEKLSGAEFDKAYMNDMVKDHKTDVAEFERESKDATDPAVKSFAQQTLPVLREHLSLAEQIAPSQNAQAGTMGNTTSASNR